MVFPFASLQRSRTAHPGSRWWVVLALALSVLFGTSMGVHEESVEATGLLVAADPLDFEPVAQGKNGQKAGKVSVEKRSGGGADKLDQPPGMPGGTEAFFPAHARTETPLEPLWRRLAPPQPERLLRPPDA